MRLTDTGVMLCGAALFVSASALGDDSAVPPPYQPFPAGYGYMEHVQALQQATNKGDRAIIREHGWKLWAGIMQPDAASGWPLWFTWPNTKGAFTARRNQGSRPLHQSNGDIGRFDEAKKQEPIH